MCLLHEPAPSLREGQVTRGETPRWAKNCLHAGVSQSSHKFVLPPGGWHQGPCESFHSTQCERLNRRSVCWQRQMKAGYHLAASGHPPWKNSHTNETTSTSTLLLSAGNCTWALLLVSPALLARILEERCAFKVYFMTS